MRIFFSVGDPSGDLHGANLIHELRAAQPEIQHVGYGGPKMAAAGCQLLDDLTKLAIMGPVRVLRNLRKLGSLLRRAERYFDQHAVDAVVLIDYPGFNWWIARKAKQCGLPVFYYGAPQMWAWASWRVKRMKRLVDHVLCKLPFEAQWYHERGCRTTYVGHPYYDEIQRHKLNQQFLDDLRRDPRPLVTILPGSRVQEVQANLHCLLKAAKIVRQHHAHVRFAVASFNEVQGQMARIKCRDQRLDVDVFVGRTPELMHLAHCCMACSGSVSLELLYHLKPTVILYQIPRIGWFGQAVFRKVKYITLVNLLATDDIRSTSVRVFDPDAPGAEHVPFPEYLSFEDKSVQIAAHIRRWLTDPGAREGRISQLSALKAKYCQPGASRVAAQYILREMNWSRPPARRASPAA